MTDNTQPKHGAMALVHREQQPSEDGHGRHRAKVVDMVERRNPGTHMHPELRRKEGQGKA